ncbi:MAG: MgtC/SapB family protein [Dehalococcoidales bacterium]|nr:MgtC/SapB family protein [Dehalococcoidales bacterium]
MPPELEMSLRLLLAAALGAAIGIQREIIGKPAGLRTHMLIAIGAAMFTVISIYGFFGAVDPSRVAAGVVAGVGFLGAGAIIFRSQEGYVTGLTTAATIWVTAGIGMAAGSGLYIASAVVTALALAVLFIPHIK